MKERPILFSERMVRAILEGSKTQTRRVANPQPIFISGRGSRVYRDEDFKKSWEFIRGTGESEGLEDCPYGQPGDRLWVRETWRPNPFPTGWPYEYRATAEQDMTPTDGRWKPSIHMPRAASRILLEIQEVRIERLHDITEADAKAEGIGEENAIFSKLGALNIWQPVPRGYRHIEGFKVLWKSINGPGSWDANPWVWVITFKRIEP